MQLETGAKPAKVRVHTTNNMADFNNRKWFAESFYAYGRTRPSPGTHTAALHAAVNCTRYNSF